MLLLAEVPHPFEHLSFSQHRINLAPIGKAEPFAKHLAGG